ncbi:related to phosphatidylinositol phosphate phosphatase [Cephalotrichum gorgonifer]|uniref:phosphoinositide 5-phosphatase n=1 Tax=Cephalotrichum gorgonifer TaxID=2041049 RepID=A0AAE8SQW5_9PEZI|nr:related to phosphatidylinositol phosphate phosphatase [Cephalotrichum gorgonifer]
MDRPPTTGQRPMQLHPSPGPEKSCQVFIRDHPHRSIAIVSSSHCLIFRYSSTASENSSQVSVAGARSRNAGDGAQPRCIVEFSRNTNHVLANYRPLTSQPIFGTLGLTAVDGDVFLCVVTHATRAASLRPAETVERISSVEFYCLNTSAYDDVFSLNTPDADLSDTYAENLARRELSIEQHPCQDLRKVLSNGTFYYSTDFDLTNRLQERPASNASFDIDNFNESFLWNSFMINPLIKFRSRLMPREREALDNSRILTSAIRGFCGTMTIPQAAAPVAPKSSRLPSFLSVISRLSCKRAGTRFNARGIDDDGNVANFVETETVYWSPAGVIFSYVQVRGSLPVFWEQAPDLIPGRQKITITRSPDGTQPAFNKHFQELEGTYGAVHIVNLLSDAKPGEAELTQLYRYGASHCPLSMPGENRSSDHALLRSTEYDFHAETKAMGYEAAKGIRKYIESSIDAFAYYLAQEADDSADGGSVSPGKNARLVVVLQQEGVFRTNCLDCLDRTNLIQTMISQMAVEAFLGHRGEYAASDFWMRHSSLWADNGDSLSKIYAGTGALKTSFTRTGKMSLSGAMADFRKSAQRLYHNNFTDPSRQITIDLLLGRLVGQQPVQLFDPISDYVSQELSKRSLEYSTSQVISIYVGTFNLNGRTNGVQEDLSSWLWPESSGSTLPDIVVIGFQEIVELSPQQIMNSDPTRKQLWEQAVKQALNARARKAGQDKYVLLRSGQLVGAALCIFVKSSVLGNIKNVEGSVKKTGMSGMAGNKGAVAIRLDYASTQICFVTAHLAAGFANYDERNRDFATIHDGLRFQRNRGIDDHDTIIWLGDFNYRIGLDRETTISLVQRGDIATLYDNDQLNLQMVAGLAFPYYSESKITFLPTYRYDIGTDDFDTSEKARIPAWTDRILRKGSNIKQLAYGSAPLRFSDHRPVYAVFQCIVNVVDEKVRQSISEDLYRKRKADIGDSSAIIEGDSSDDEDLIGYDAIEPGLPPASSDQQKWWLANGQFARVDMTPPTMGSGRMSTVLNPNRPANPFSPTDEPDWVSVPRSSSRQSQSSMASSAYEMINNSTVLSTSAGTPAGRRLPPPYDPGTTPAAKVGRGGGLDETNGRSTPAQKTVARETPPPPLPRRQASTSASQARPVGVKPLQKTRTAPPPPPSRTVSGGGQKAPPPPQVTKESKPSAPPVAKKPSYLASASPPHTTTTFPAGERTGGEGVAGGSSRPPLPVRSSTGIGGSPLSSSAGAGAAAVGSVGRKPVAPPKPPKPAAAMAAAAKKPVPPRGAVRRDGGAVDLLDSLEGDGMGGFSGWETLKPTE